MNLEWYIAFLSVAKHLNYRKAADQLYRSQPTVFQQVKKLEQHHNLVLFEMNGKLLKLTDAGQQFVPLAESLIDTYLNVKESSYKLSTTKHQRIKLGVSRYVADYLIADFIEQCDCEIQIQIIDENYEQLLASNQIDIAITREYPSNQQLKVKDVCLGSIQLLVPSSESSNSESYYFDNYQVYSNNHPSYWQQLKTDIIKLSPAAKFYHLPDVRLTVELISRGQGVSYLPLYVLRDQPDLNIRAIEPNEVSKPISSVYVISKYENELINQVVCQVSSYIKARQV